MDTGKYKFWSSQICINAMTKLFHTELDSTYTVISVPHQKKDTCLPSFQFKIKEDTILEVPLQEGTTIIFSAYMLTHRQNLVIDESLKNMYPFFNVASFGNMRLFTHMRKTIQRLHGFDE